MKIFCISAIFILALTHLVAGIQLAIDKNYIAEVLQFDSELLEGIIHEQSENLKDIKLDFGSISLAEDGQNSVRLILKGSQTQG